VEAQRYGALRKLGCHLRMRLKPSTLCCAEDAARCYWTQQGHSTAAASTMRSLRRCSRAAPGDFVDRKISW